MPVRMTFPGKETANDQSFAPMDASGTTGFVIDLDTGKYIWEDYTPEENALFNAFDLGGEATQINQREAFGRAVAGRRIGSRPRWKDRDYTQR